MNDGRVAGLRDTADLRQMYPISTSICILQLGRRALTLVLTADENDDLVRKDLALV